MCISLWRHNKTDPIIQAFPGQLLQDIVQDLKDKYPRNQLFTPTCARLLI